MITPIQSKFVYWELEINGQSFNDFRQYIASISIEYAINTLPTVKIAVKSNNYLENFITKDSEVEIFFGYSMSSPIKMFSGTLDAHPEGSSDDFMSYVISGIDKSVIASKKQEVKVFHGDIKKEIISKLIPKNYKAVIEISDKNKIKANETPIQLGETDAEFIAECAAKWNCVTWVDSIKNPPTWYFVDSKSMKKIGDNEAIKRTQKPLYDLKDNYNLGYKTDYSTNNVSHITWKFDGVPAGDVGAPIRKVTAEDNVKNSVPGDYILEFENKIYTVSPSVRKNPAALTATINKQLNTGFTGSIDTNFWVLAKDNGSAKSATNNNVMELPAHKKKGRLISIDLNKGDPYLRPPRGAKLFYGSENPDAVNSALPSWLFESVANGENPRTGLSLNITKVFTQLSDGMLKTSLEATL